jgi:hypothetical protein
LYITWYQTANKTSLVQRSAAMPLQVLQRDTFDREPHKQGETFRLRKGRLAAECELWTHPLGWELRLVAGKELLQSAVCKSQDEVHQSNRDCHLALPLRKPLRAMAVPLVPLAFHASEVPRRDCAGG